MFENILLAKCCDHESILVSDFVEYSRVEYKAEEQNQPSGDGFLQQENELAVLIALLLKIKYEKEAKTILQEALQNQDSARNIYNAINKANAVFKTTYEKNKTVSYSNSDVQNIGDKFKLDKEYLLLFLNTNTLNTSITTTNIIQTSINKGASVTNSVLNNQNAINKQTILSNIEDLIQESSNKYFGEILAPQIQTKVEKILSEAVSFTGNQADVFVLDKLDEVKAFVEKQFAGDPYHKLVGNLHASRSYHYGALQGALNKGYKSYKYNAILDNRTSDICKYLNGRVFPIREGLETTERILKTKYSDLKNTFPFAKSVDDINKKTSQELAALGYTVPPQHFNCRSSITLLKI